VILVSHIVRAPRACYLSGLAISVGAIVYSAWGFYLRIIITQRAPVTNMYETVIWAAFVVAVLGLIFALQPVIGPGMSWSWKLCGFPLRLRRIVTGHLAGIEVDPLQPDDRGRWLSTVYMPIKMVMTGVRLVFGAGLMWFLTSSDTTFAIITPLPPISAGISDLAVTKLGTWLVGMSTVLLSAWYLPRVALSLVLGLGTVVTEGRRGQSEEMWSKLLGRRFFSFPAMIVACFGMMLAHFVGTMSPEILNPEIGSIAAVLRNNYWLTIHVLTISSSYGAGALAWGLGNLALAYYLFGKYRSDNDRLAAMASGSDTVVSRLRKAGGSLMPANLVGTLREGLRGMGPDEVDTSPSRMRPPREVATLATFSYRVMQVAVLLLAAGTILGGLWADVSWGRFWDWDPKEVWALISLLVYLVVLHGRFAGWFGTLGTNVGSVLCFTAIVFSWYGVNFVLPQVHGWLQGTNKPTEVGLHSYATGAGGLEWVVGAVLLNMMFLIAAVGRFVVETRVSAAAPKPAE
jgi:ABC-type transport system involved in cytochrome c biogenesis permease subunit